MRFFAKTVFEHIRKQIERHIRQGEPGSKLLFMMPSVPATVVTEVGNRLVNYCAEQSRTISPLIKVANILYREWEAADDVAIRKQITEIYNKGWRDEQGNLTSYRNASAKQGEFLVILLIGVDRVTDSSSLADFHHCDFRTIWKEELQGSFAPWVSIALNESSVGFEENTLHHFDVIFQSSIEYGLADILQISTLLEELNLKAAQDGRDAEKILLRSLGCFGLPSFSTYKFSTRRSFGPYVGDAISFFSYDAFLEDRPRQRAVETIEKFLKHRELGELFDQSVREPFDSDKAFIDALTEYIKTGNDELCIKLRRCDFVTIRDHILGFRAPKEPKPKKETVKKLTGGPVQVVLTALWNTLAEFKEEAVRQRVFAQDVLSLREIRIESCLFKHDCDGESPDERALKARTYLTRLLGGIDNLLEQQIAQTKLCREDQNVLVHSHLVREDIDCQSARSAEPFLQFSVELVGEGWERPVTKQFAWRLPEIEPYRIVDELVRWAAQGIEKAGGYCLPVFHVPYYEELMLAKDDEEIRRVLRQCIQDEGGSIFNLLSVSDLDKDDPLLKHVQKLAFEYGRFIQKAQTEGLHTALEDDWDSLRKAYEDAFDAYLFREPECAGSPLAQLLFRSFLIVCRRRSEEGDRWVWDKFEPSGVVTILHPALLEMLQAHERYLFTCFGTIAGNALSASDPRAFHSASAVWQNYIDLAAIQMPLSGLIKDRNHILDTNVRGENLIHRIGSIGNREASLTTRMLLRYDAFDEEDVSDTDLFHKSRESMLIYRILRDYRKMHPHADDGLSIAIYQNQDIQPIIAAVDQFLSEVYSEVYEDNLTKPHKYTMSVTIFTESSDDACVSRWINQWKERWEASETLGSLAHYQYSHLSVAHRLVSHQDYYHQFRKLIDEGLEVDIAILNRFIGAGEQENDFKRVEPYVVTSRTLKFPILEKSFCAVRDPGRKFQRARILSNRQFHITTRHAELMARLKNQETQQNTHHVVLGFGDYKPWEGVVDKLHQRAEWVVCIDPSIDEQLIYQKHSDTLEEREIIGFGSGVGSHGEANYTISTEQFSLADVLYRLTASIREVYSGWSADVYESVAKGVLAESRRLSGLSLVRATGVGHYIRDFMAYALTRKILSAGGDALCDQLVSLDAYRHWFDSADSDTRPDLLWIIARVGDDGRFHLDLRLIECKLAKMADTHKDKSQQQLENGLRHLIAVFTPRLNNRSIEDDRPDQRYWWLQIHRLIASKAEITRRDQERRVLTALERLAEGDYDIEWRAAAIFFWTDHAGANLSLNDVWPYAFEEQELGINVVSAGSTYVRTLCTAKAASAFPWEGSPIQFDATIIPELPIMPKDGEEKESIEPSASCIEFDHEESNVPLMQPPDEEGDVGQQQRTLPPMEIKIPDRILLGTTSKGSRPVYWEFGHKELTNRHMLVFGTSGMGKTYTIQCLLYELGRCGQNSLIVDYTNGFFDNQLEEEFKAFLQPVQHVVRKKPLSINPFRQQQVEVINGESISEGDANTAQRISGVFGEVYSFGDQQKSALYQAVKRGITASGEAGMTLTDLIPYLEEISKEKGSIGSSARSVISKILPFVDQNPFGVEDPESWERLFNDSQQRCHVIQLAGFLPDAARLITEFSLIDLFWFYRGRGTKDCPRVVVLDEVQNLDHREESPLAKLLREGRKFGFSLILATQIMSNLQKDERDRLFNAAHKLFFRPADTEVRTYADIIAISTNEKADIWMNHLTSLEKGECYSLGPSLNEATGKLEAKPFRIRITSLSERSSNI
ncbi:MAG: DUF87 domain-containing protein [bacterium]